MGPGTALRKIVEAFGMRPNESAGKSCDCQAIEHWMNRMGPDRTLRLCEQVSRAVKGSAARMGVAVELSTVRRAVKAAVRLSRITGCK